MSGKIIQGGLKGGGQVMQGVMQCVQVFCSVLQLGMADFLWLFVTWYSTLAALVSVLCLYSISIRILFQLCLPIDFLSFFRSSFEGSGGLGRGLEVLKFWVSF